MWKLTFDLCFEPILRGLRKLYEMFSDYSLFQPRLDKLDKGLVLLGIVALFLVGMLLLALENWEAQLVVLKWAALGGAPGWYLSVTRESCKPQGFLFAYSEELRDALVRFYGPLDIEKTDK